MAATGLPDGAYPFTPYCGSPPTPASLLHRWNLDPVLIAVLALGAAAYAWSAARRGGPAPWRRACFYAGWAVGSLALVSPLCPLSVSLFSARVGQHMILTSVAAPLVALGRPLSLIRPRLDRWAAEHALPAAAAFALCLWTWHMPGPYLATFQSDTVYWLMHVTTIAAAFWLWSALLDGEPERLAAFAAASALTTGQMGLLGAVITFAGHPLYVPHLFTTQAWGLTPMADQQLGGAVMWVPAGVILAGALAFAFTEAMRRAETRALARSAR